MKTVSEALTHRFASSSPRVPEEFENHPMLQLLANRRSVRSFRDAPVAPELIHTLSALALSAPTKSDLQQSDIIVISDHEIRAQLNKFLADQNWIAKAPAFLVFCANNRRQRLVHEWRGHPFANDHLDAFFNASVDAGITLATFVLAAEAAGLGCCPVSAIRNKATEVSALMNLPDHVFPVAGLGLGWPAAEGDIKLRLPLNVTVHTDRYSEEALRQSVEAYDRRRATLQPYRTQRHLSDYGECGDYGWSEDKARQFSKPEREDFGSFIRAKGFDLS